jgi:hypothetical protein
MIKSFRAKLAHDTSSTIRLSTTKGEIGYRIHKFQLMFTNPGDVNTESVVKIFTVPQDTPNAEIDFDDSTLLASAYISGSNSPNYPDEIVVVFDNVAFNQDIYVTHFNANPSAEPCNYYLELEQMKLNLNEATVATLKDMRGRN